MLLASSAVDTDNDEHGDDEEEDEPDPELLKAIEAEVKSRRAIEKSERSAASKGVERTEVPSKNKGESVVATSIRGHPPMSAPFAAHANPFATPELADSSGGDLPVHAPTVDAPVENLLEKMQCGSDAAAATSSASPTHSLSGLSSMLAAATNANTPRRKLSTINWTARPIHLKAWMRWRRSQSAFRAPRT